jgi:hypothetical protein
MANQLLNTVEWAKRFVNRRPLANGNYLEPAVTSANTIMQTILGAPFRWRWNRVVTGFVTTTGQQDYTIFNWTASTPVSIGYVLVDTNGFSQQVTTPGTTGSSIPSFNSTVGGTTTDGTAIWTNKGLIGGTGLSTSYRFGWIENASLKEQDPNTCQLEWRQISPKIDLALDSGAGRPSFISGEFDDANGNVTFRLMPAPDKAYPISITIQQKPPIMDGLESTWSPIPDEYSRLYNWGFLSLIYMFADDPRFVAANQKFIANLLSTAGGLTETEMNIWLNNWQAITGQPITLAGNIQQGRAGRGNL